jgi:hypothetical protein
MATIQWAGGTHNWSDTAAWVGGVVPTSADDVRFTTNTTGTLTIDGTSGAPSECLSMVCTSFTGTITHAAGKQLNVYGTLTFVSGMTYTPSATSLLVFKSTSGTSSSWTSGGKTLGAITVNDGGSGSTLSWVNAALNVAGLITITAGTMATNAIVPTFTAGLTINGGTLTMGGNITLTNTGLTVSSGTCNNPTRTITATSLTNSFSGGTVSLSVLTCSSGGVTITGTGSLTLAAASSIGALSVTDGTYTNTAANTTCTSLVVAGTGTVNCTGRTLTGNSTITNNSASGSITATTLTGFTNVTNNGGSVTVTTVSCTSWAMNSGTLTLNGTMTLTSSFACTSTGTLSASGGTITGATTVTISSSNAATLGTISAITGLLSLNTGSHTVTTCTAGLGLTIASGTQTIPTLTVSGANLNINTTGVLVTNTSVTLTGIGATISNSADWQGVSSIAIGGTPTTLTVSTTTPLSFLGVSLSGAYTHNGTGPSTVTFGSTGLTAGSISIAQGGLTCTAANTVVSGTCNVTGTGSLDCTGRNLTGVTSGTWSTSGVVNVSTLSCSGTITATNGVFTVDTFTGGALTATSGQFYIQDGGSATGSITVGVGGVIYYGRALPGSGTPRSGGFWNAGALSIIPPFISGWAHNIETGHIRG